MVVFWQEVSSLSWDVVLPGEAAQAVQAGRADGVEQGLSYVRAYNPQYDRSYGRG
jgi:hypothetical protein